MATRKSASGGGSRGTVRQTKTANTSRAVTKIVRPAVAPHVKTTSNGQPRPKRHSK